MYWALQGAPGRGQWSYPLQTVCLGFLLLGHNFLQPLLLLSCSGLLPGHPLLQHLLEVLLLVGLQYLPHCHLHQSSGPSWQKPPLSKLVQTLFLSQVLVPGVGFTAHIFHQL